MNELVNALKVIKSHCASYAGEECCNCPMGSDDGECLIGEDIPENWKIVEPKTVVRVME